jgi:hypothetical protein
MRTPHLRVGGPVCGALAIFFAGLVLVACGSSDPGSGKPAHRFGVSIEPGSRAGQLPVRAGRSPSLGLQAVNPTKAGGVQLNVLSGLRDDAPIFDGDFADPFVLRSANALYVLASNTVTSQYAPAAHIPEIELTRDSDFRGRYLGDALPTLPKWTVTGFQWAPSVLSRPDGTYVMYYSTPATIPLICLAKPSSAGCVRTNAGPRTAMCISRATSTSPTGPFVDDSSSAFICPYQQGGAIDPSVFIAADGTPWLLWKVDGDCCNLPTTIYSQQLSSDGLSTVGPPNRLIGATQPWEGNLVEGPSMLEANNTYWLFYSANLWGTNDYGIGIARCESVVGPCTKPLRHAWLSSAGGAGGTDPGPGGQEFFQSGGLIWMVHHGLAPGQSGNEAQRRLYVDLLALPAHGIPQVAPGDPSAALAEAVLYYADPVLPPQPQTAYLTLLHEVPGAFSDDSDTRVIADGSLSCRDLKAHDSAAQVLQSLSERGLTPFEGYLVAEFSTEYFCPQYTSQALTDVRQSLDEGS